MKKSLSILLALTASVILFSCDSKPKQKVYITLSDTSSKDHIADVLAEEHHAWDISEDPVKESKLSEFSTQQVEDKMEDHPKRYCELKNINWGSNNQLGDLGISAWKNPSGRRYDLGLFLAKNVPGKNRQDFSLSLVAVRIRFENSPAQTYSVNLDYNTGVAWFYERDTNELIHKFKSQKINPENPLKFWIEVTESGVGREQYEFRLDRPLDIMF